MQRHGKNLKSFSMRLLKNIDCFFTLLIVVGAKAQTKDTAHIFSSSLNAVIANNEAYGNEHRQRYNGVAELYNTNTTKNTFVPKYAGLNFEHIFSGDSITYYWNTYECRPAP